MPQLHNEKMPKNAEIVYLYDGEPRGEIFNIWVARNGKVLIADDYEVVYSDDARPSCAPSREEERYWKIFSE